MLNKTALQNLCRLALAEDIGRGDATTLAVIPETLEVTALIVAREDCVCAGLPVAGTLFHELDSGLDF
jgi:nicotinate-nucleotide pyrophosphorylase (carboxylating)